MLAVLILCRSLESNHNYYEFISAMALPFSEDSIFLQPFFTIGSDAISAPSFMMVLNLGSVVVGGDIYVPFEVDRIT